MRRLRPARSNLAKPGRTEMKARSQGTQTALVLLLLLLLVVALPADAQVSSTNVLDKVVVSFSDATANWGKIFQAHAMRLFFGLAAISMVWTYGLLALKQADISEFMAETIKFIVFLGFFLWLLENGPGFADKIIRSMRQMGSEAIGRTDVLSPSKVVDIGFKIFFLAVDQISMFSPVVSSAALIMSGIILAALAYLSFGMIKLLCAAWVLAYAGVFFLGFGGSRWTSDIAVYYYKTVLGVAAELMTMTLLVGVGQSLIEGFAKANGDTINLKSLAAMLISCLLLYVLCNSLPARVASIATGGAVGGSGGGGIGAAALLAGATMGGLAAKNIAQGLAGGADAVGAALQSAKAAAAAGNGPGGIGGIAMGTAGRLASAMGSVAASSAGKFAFGTPDDRKKTLGGRMADQIRKKDAPPDDPAQSSKPGAFGSQAGGSKTSQPTAGGQVATPGGSSGTSPSPASGGNSFGAGSASSSGGPAAAGPAGSPKAASPEVEAFARPKPTTNS